ncbi:MAG: phosphonoacetate hydrolase [Chloroflexota bacterium]
MPASDALITVNGRDYRPPSRPTVVFTIDGCQPAYLDDGMARGLMPRLSEMLAGEGAYHLGRGQMPSLTNPNNVSIVTGASPAVHGIAGNHFRAPDGSEVQLTDPSHLRAPTILGEMRRAGMRVLAVTAKDKLRRLLAEGDVPSISAERAGELGLPALGIEDVPALVGRPVPKIYEWDASAYAAEIGLAVHQHLLARDGRGLDLLYVSTTDFVQHKEAPGEPMADQFYTRLDQLLGEFLDAGFVIGLTADHGMSAKQEPDGTPRVIYLEDVLDGLGVREYHVVLPITDPYVLHHGALGSFAWVYLPDADRERVRAAFVALDGVEEVYPREEATVIYEHPGDRIGDLTVASDARTALGKARAKHDLSLVETGLRSHGGRHEQVVPIVVSHRLTERYTAWHASGVQSRDLFDLVLNGLAI